MDYDKPELDDDLLMHFGVKGMKWGVTRSRPSASEIYTARNKVARQANDIRNKKKSVARAVRTETREKRKGELAAVKLAYLKNPDRATALRITKGDLAISALLSTPLSGSTAAAGIAAGAATRLARRKFIENRQAKGVYDKKRGGKS